jgi:hypothetical protein
MATAPTLSEIDMPLPVLIRGNTYTFERDAAFEFGPGFGWYLTQFHADGSPMGTGEGANYDAIPNGEEYQGWVVSFSGDSITFTISPDAASGVWRFDWNTDIFGSAGAQFHFELQSESPGGESPGGVGPGDETPAHGEANRENTQYQRFPTQIVPESNHSPEWQPLRADSPGASARKRMQSRPYWSSDLSNCLCDERQKDILLGMIVRNMGMVRPVLMFVPIFCEIGTVEDYDDNGEPLVEPAFLGAAGPGMRSFQIRKRLLVPGYEHEYYYYTVTKPHFKYPMRYGLGRTIRGTVEYNPLREFTVYDANHIPLDTDYWMVDRNTGIVTVTDDYDGALYCDGGFYILMLMPNKIPMMPEGYHYKIQQGISLMEPPGGL